MTELKIKNKSISIVGSGAWGSALAIALSDKFNTIYLIAKDNEEIKNLGNQHKALKTPFNKKIVITADIKKISTTKAILIATPSYAFTDILKKIAPYISKNTYIAWTTKGFDTKNNCFLSETFAKIMPDQNACIISGPTFAMEIANKEPSAIVVAAKNKDVRNYWRNTIKTQHIRSYESDDIVGVEIGGCVKNILAIATGISKGLGFGANAQAALITRGLVEMTRLGVVLGAKKSTLQGLAGMGDLILTCSCDLSRNRRFGKELATGINAQRAMEKIGATVEGYNNIELLLNIANKAKVEMPICREIFAVIKNKKTAQDAVLELMQRDNKTE